MMKGRFLLVPLLGLIILVGCTHPGSGSAPPQAQDPYFRPKRVYAVDFNQAWDLTLRALNREGISLEIANKETGLIQTGYRNLSPWERNKCDLRFSQEPQRKTFINVRCQYESRKEATEPFRVFTYGVPQEAMKAEEEIYRKIDPYILPFERNPMAQEELVAKGELQPPPPPIVITPPAKPEETSAPAPSARSEGKAEPPAPPPEAVSSPPPSMMAELKAELKAAPAVREPPSPKLEAPPPLASPAAVAQENPRITKEKLSTYLITIEAANVRLAPSVQSKVITVLKKGERVEKVGESGVWTKIKLTSGEVAWVHSDFVQEVGPPTARETVKKRVEGTSKIFLVTKAIVKMRAEPSATSRVVLVLKKGREVEKIGESGEYTKVRLSWGDMGWVPTRSLERVR